MKSSPNQIAISTVRFNHGAFLRGWATEAEEQGLAQAVLKARKIRVVLHLEQPAKHSKLRPRAINPADVKQKLRQLLKPIDAHPFVAEKAARDSLQWSVI